MKQLIGLVHLGALTALSRRALMARIGKHRQHETTL